MEGSVDSIVLVQDLLQVLDVVHGRLERVHLAHLFVFAAIRDVLAERGEAEVD